MAAKPVRFHEQADTEYDDALDWYFARSPQAAAEFAEELTRAVEFISGTPSLGTRSRWYSQISPPSFSVCFDLSRTSSRRASARRRPYPPQTWLLERSPLNGRPQVQTAVDRRQATELARPASGLIRLWSAISAYARELLSAPPNLRN